MQKTVDWVVMVVVVGGGRKKVKGGERQVNDW